MEINYVESNVRVICKKNESYEKIARLYKKNLVDYSNSLLINSTGLLVTMSSEIETNFMEDHAADFLNGVVKYAQEVEADAKIEGSITWEDESYNTGEIHLIEQNGLYVVSNPVFRDRVASVLHNASDEELTTQLSKRGYTVTLTPAGERADKFRVKIPGGYLMVEAKGVENEYPGVYISFSEDGKTYDVSNMVACVEYDSCSEEVRTATYRKGFENPDHIISHKNGIDLS